MKDVLCLCFNTASGKYYCFITFVLPSLRLGTWDERTSSSLFCSAASHSAAHTVNGKYCCFITFVLSSLCSGTWDGQTSLSLCTSAVSHPSAHTPGGRCCCNLLCYKYLYPNYNRFNTASSSYHCFITFVLPSLRSGTWDGRTSSSLCSSAASHSAAHTASVRCYCNTFEHITELKQIK